MGGKRTARAGQWLRYLPEACFALYVLMLCVRFLGATTFRFAWPAGYDRILRAAAVVLVFARTALPRPKSPRRDAASVALVAVFLIASVYSGYDALLDLAVMTLLMRDLPTRRVLKAFFGAVGILFAFTLLMALQGKIENYRYDDIGGMVRNSLGMSSPTDFSACVLMLSLVWACLREGRATPPEPAAIALAGLAAYWATGATLTLICQLLLAAAMGIGMLPGGARVKRGFANACAWALPVCAALAFLLMLTKGALPLADPVLGARIDSARATLAKYGVSLFGQSVPVTGAAVEATGVLWEDSVFRAVPALCYIPMRHGIIVYMALIAALTGVARRFLRAGRRMPACAIALLAVHALGDRNFMELSWQPFLLLSLAELSPEAERVPQLPSGKAARARRLRRRRQLLTMLALCYAVASVLLLWLWGDDFDYGSYGMGVTDEEYAEQLTEDFGYRQYFYAPMRTDGIWLKLKKTKPWPQHGIRVQVGDAATGEILGETTLTTQEVKDGYHTRIPFEGVRLNGAGFYFFRLAAQPRLGENDTGCYTVSVGRSASRFVDELYFGDRRVPGRAVNFNVAYRRGATGLRIWLSLTVMTALILLPLAASGRRRERASGRYGAFMAASVLLAGFLYGGFMRM